MNHFASLSPKKLGSCHHLLEVLRSHWSIGIPAPALTAHLVCWSASSDPLSWLLPSWAGHWQQHQCRQEWVHSFHSTAHPDNSMRAEVFQLLHRVEHLRAKTSSHGSSSSSKGSFVSKMTHCGDHRQGHSVSWDTPASDMQCILRDVWKRVKDSGIFLRSYKSLVVNDNTCHE